MADSRILLSGLKEYRRSLGTHLSRLTTEFQQLDRIWRQFDRVYQGDAADQFREGWQRTTRRFEDYIEQTDKISRLLDERIADLEQVNRTEGGLIG